MAVLSGANTVVHRARVASASVKALNPKPFLSKLLDCDVMIMPGEISVETFLAAVGGRYYVNNLEKLERENFGLDGLLDGIEFPKAFHNS